MASNTAFPSGRPSSHLHVQPDQPVDLERFFVVLVVPCTTHAVDKPRVVAGVTVSGDHPNDGVADRDGVRNRERSVVVGWKIEDRTVIVDVGNFHDDGNFAAQYRQVLIDRCHCELIAAHNTSEVVVTNRF